jgi:ATP-dependent protease ClpP protease subunit
MKNIRGIKPYASERAHLIERIRAKSPKLAADLSDLKLDWYRIQNVAEDETDIMIYEEIGMFWGISAEDFIKDLKQITTSTINVRINSPGGSVFEAIAIYNALVSHQSTINVYVDALAASAASMIAMAGDKITVMRGGQLMIHDALGIEMGNAAQLREFADWLDGQSNNIASIYAARAGGTVEEWRGRMLAETWLFAEEAVELGLADEVYSKPEKSKEAPTPPGESEEDDEEEDDTEEESEEDDDDVVDISKIRHNISNRGFRYAGRKRAPAPIDEDDDLDSLVDNFVATMQKVL